MDIDMRRHKTWAVDKHYRCEAIKEDLKTRKESFGKLAKRYRIAISSLHRYYVAHYGSAQESVKDPRTGRFAGEPKFKFPGPPVLGNAAFHEAALEDLLEGKPLSTDEPVKPSPETADERRQQEIKAIDEDIRQQVLADIEELKKYGRPPGYRNGPSPVGVKPRWKN